ncbi:hypothetical protein B0T16DRAFT_310797, partial [Cercophora newfieldiana]
MRLLNARTLCFQDFIGENVPKYAILSHTWGQGEVTFQELEAYNASKASGCTVSQTTLEKPGYTKILKTAEQTVGDGLEYNCVGTCCIDKTSSAELSEAINSMMRWYERADVCYTHLADVPSGLGEAQQNELFGRSRWFTRGWTLQELIAPPELVFSADWTRIATRKDLAELVGLVTGIHDVFLTGREPVQ